MRHLNITHFNGQRPVTYLFSDDKAAELAYEKIKGAMAQHKPFGNDKDTTVTIKGDKEPEELTLRIDHLTAVGIADPLHDEPIQIEDACRSGRIARAYEHTKGKGPAAE